MTNKEIAELRAFFSCLCLKNKELQLSKCEKITNLEQFVESHLAIICANLHKINHYTYKVYLERLLLAKDLLTQNRKDDDARTRTKSIC